MGRKKKPQTLPEFYAAKEEATQIRFYRFMGTAFAPCFLYQSCPMKPCRRKQVKSGTQQTARKTCPPGCCPVVWEDEPSGLDQQSAHFFNIPGT